MVKYKESEACALLEDQDESSGKLCQKKIMLVCVAKLQKKFKITENIALTLS